MKFESGAKLWDLTVVIRPARVVIDNGYRDVTPAIRAEFRNHEFDSVKAQEGNGWSDEEREQVEQRLMKHQLYGRRDGRGFWVMGDKATAPKPEDNLPTVMRCLAFVPMDDGTVEQCSNNAVEGAQHCENCAKLAAAASQV